MLCSNELSGQGHLYRITVLVQRVETGVRNVSATTIFLAMSCSQVICELPA